LRDNHWWRHRRGTLSQLGFQLFDALLGPLLVVFKGGVCGPQYSVRFFGHFSSCGGSVALAFSSLHPLLLTLV
jgi:hypothetical protein